MTRTDFKGVVAGTFFNFTFLDAVPSGAVFLDIVKILLAGVISLSTQLIVKWFDAYLKRLQSAKKALKEDNEDTSGND